MISFIVIGRNEGWRLEKCFKGISTFVKAEHIPDYEVIYVDSQSTDNSIELSKSFHNTKTLLITGECNAAIARNIGAKEANGDILFFLDGDMELIPGFWSSVMKEGKMVYPFMSGLENNFWHDSDWNYVNSSINRKYTEGADSYEVTTGGLFVIEVELWKKVGGMDNRCKRSQDLDFGFKLTKIGCRLCRKPQEWVNHYTRYYQARSDSSAFVKYTAFLTRKHFFEPFAQKFMFGVNYSLWILFFSFLLMFCYTSLIPSALYFLAVILRAFRTHKKIDTKIGILSLVVGQIKNDFSFIYYFICFRPPMVPMEYELR